MGSGKYAGQLKYRKNGIFNSLLCTCCILYKPCEWSTRHYDVTQRRVLSRHLARGEGVGGGRPSMALVPTVPYRRRGSAVMYCTGQKSHHPPLWRHKLSTNIRSFYTLIVLCTWAQGYKWDYNEINTCPSSCFTT